MTEALLAAALAVVLLASITVGFWLRTRLDARHLSPDAVDSVRLLMGMLLTFSALVLGLLTSNAKQRFDGLSDGLSAYAADLIELDHRLRTYGPEADAIRAQLRRYTAAAIADSWPQEARPTGRYPVFVPGKAGGIEGRALGDMLSAVDDAIEDLKPAGPRQEQIAARLRSRIVNVIEARWRLVFASRSDISWPFLLILGSWLSIIFVIMGITSPRGRVVFAVALLSALSISSPIYLILDYGEALGGTISLPSAPLRLALAHMDSP